MSALSLVDLTVDRSFEAVMAAQKLAYSGPERRFLLMDPERRIDLAERMIQVVEPGRSLYAYQKRFLLAGNDFRWRKRVTNKSRQVGYTTGASIEVAIDAVAFPKFLTIFVSTKEDRSKEMLERSVECMRTMGERVFLEDILGDDGTDTAKLLRTSHGSRVLAVTKNPKNVRSQTPHRIYFDEIGYMEEQEKLLRAGGPAAARRGVLTMFSNPNPDMKGCLFERVWAHREKLGYWWDEVPWTECPDLTVSYIEQAREECRLLGLSFGAEYECSFDSDATMSPMSWESLKAHVTSTPKTTDGIRVMGWDPGKTRHTSSVLILQIESGKKEVIKLEQLSGMAAGNTRTPYPDQTKRVLQLVEDYGVSKLYVDDWAQGEPLADFLTSIQHKVVRVKMKQPNKRAAARYIAYELDRENLWFAQGELTDRLLRDLNNFNIETGEFAQNSDGHGDLGTAMFLAWQAIPKQVRRTARDVGELMRNGAGADRVTIGGRSIPMEAFR